MSLNWIPDLVYSVVPFVFVISILIFVHEFGHFWVARKCGVRVEKFSLGFGKELFGWTRGETRYSVSAIPVGGYVKMAGESPEETGKGEPWEYFAKPISKRMLIVAAGPGVNFLAGIFLLFVLYMSGHPTLPPTIGILNDGYPAEEAGLKIGDTITAIDGESIRSFVDIIYTIQDKVDAPIELSIDREGVERTAWVHPNIEMGRDRFGREKEIAKIGIGPTQDIVFERHAPWHAVRLAWRDTLFFTTATYRGLWYMVTGQTAFRKSVTGPVGILMLTNERARLGIPFLVQFMAIISIALAIFNFLPIPILDGGHLLFLALEKLRGGRPVSFRIQEIVQHAAFVLLVTLMLVVSVNDFINFQVVDRFIDWLPFK